MARERKQSAVDGATTRLINWLRRLARENNGNLPAFTNATAIAAVYHGETARFARAHGNVQSRVDFACFRCNLPPLGLTADAPFKNAWSRQDRDWEYPVHKMQAAAQTHLWTDEDFDKILAATGELPGRADQSWNQALTENPESVRAWAESFGAIDAMPRPLAALAPIQRIDWSRDELILALDLYLKNRGSGLDDTDPKVVELSELLNRMGAVIGVASGSNFRNPNGVAMKLMKFRSIDPNYIQAGKAGLKKGNKLEGPIWAEFSNDQSRLTEIAAAIRSAVSNFKGELDLTGDDEPEIEEAPEGKLLTSVHRARERSRKLVAACKQRALKKYGRLFCVGCDFDFAKKYGTEAAPIIDCHHTKPVSTLGEDGKTHIKDLILLCANCHRVVHSTKRWLSLDELRFKLKTAAAASANSGGN